MIEMRAKGKDEEIGGRGKGIDERNGVGGWIKKQKKEGGGSDKRYEGEREGGRNKKIKGRQKEDG